MDAFVRGRVRKLFVRLGLRGHHPHPPAPSPASGRGGAARALARASGVAAREFWGSSGGSASGGELRGFVCVLLPSPRVGERGWG
ncbi:MAG: hypothetical protein RL240_72 [Planctomycetota bacterium]